MGKVRTITMTHTLDGTSGNTTTATTHQGKLLAVEVNYPAATVTVDLDATGSQSGDEKILDLAAANTDVKYYPRTALHDNTGTALDPSDAQGGDNALYGNFVINGKLKLSLASGTTTQTVTIRVFLED